MQRLAPNVDAPQHRPRPLPLFLDMVARVAAADPELAWAALAGLARYQEAPRGGLPMADVAYEPIGRARLYSYGGDGLPLMLVPSIINPPFVLDLASGNSLARRLIAAGHAVHLLDWGVAGPEHADEDFTALIDTYLAPAIARIGGDVALIGHCLGGTIALGAAARIAVRGVATIASPWTFAAYPDDTRAMLANLWARNRDTVRALGIVPIELLQTAFWTIDPARTVAKFAALADADATRLAAFVALEDWANSGAPLPYGAGNDLFEGCFGARRHDVTAHVPAVPTLHFVSTTDRIVPAGAAPDFGTRIETDAGHIGMVVGRRSGEAVVAPLLAFLAAL